jgi:hypothetical protein
MTIRRTPDDDPVMDDPNDRREVLVERVIEKETNGSYGKLKDIVFLAVILGAGGVIWGQQSTIDSIKTDVAVLKLKCEKQPVYRGGPDGN